MPLPTRGGSGKFWQLQFDEERGWIVKHKCSKDARKMTPTCAELLKQWAAYESEHEPGWEGQTLTIEGSVLLRDARSPAANQTVA